MFGRRARRTILAAGGAGLVAALSIGASAGLASATAPDGTTQYHSIAGSYTFVEPEGNGGPPIHWQLTPAGAVADSLGNHGNWTLDGTWGGPSYPEVVVHLAGCTFTALKSPTGLSSASKPGQFTCEGNAPAVYGSPPVVLWYAVRG
jgi:hypothetical protein